jgi:hypothetical protein
MSNSPRGQHDRRQYVILGGRVAISERWDDEARLLMCNQLVHP